MKKMYEVPYTYVSKGYSIVSADSPKEALEIAKLNYLTGEDETVFLRETLHFCEDEIEELNNIEENN